MKEKTAVEIVWESYVLFLIKKRFLETTEYLNMQTWYLSLWAKAHSFD